MAARRRSNSDGGFAAVFVLLLAIGLVIQYFWWIAGAGALVGLFFGGRALARTMRERRELAEEREAALKRRADRQHRWMLTGDSRGVYGRDGAAAMREMAQPSLPDGNDEAAQDSGPIARMAATADELAALERDKPRAWQYTLFTSILVQRTTPLLPRLRDSELAFALAATTRVDTGSELGRILVGLIDELLATANQLDSFMAAPAFMASFGDPADDSATDPEAIKHIAHRTMDYHERFLGLSERCRGLSVPSQYADVLTDCAQLLDIPLQSYREFIGELVDVVEALPQVLQHATGVVHLGAVALEIDIDDQLRSRFFKRLEVISRS